MKRSKRLLIGAGFLFLLMMAVSVPSWAQPARGGQAAPGIRAELRLNALADSLNLNVEQREAVAAILENHRDEGRAWMQSRRQAARAERMAFHEAHREALRAALSEVLTDEQEARLDAVLPAAPAGRGALRSGRAAPTKGRGLVGDGQRGNFRPMRGARFDGPSRQALWDQLDLSAEQQTQLNALRTEHRAAVQAWRDAHPEATRAEQAAFFQDHWKNAQAELEAILTPDQVQELEALRENRRARAPGATRNGGRMRR